MDPLTIAALAALERAAPLIIERLLPRIAEQLAIDGSRHIDRARINADIARIKHLGQQEIAAILKERVQL
jgi:hypothetical protein